MNDLIKAALYNHPEVIPFSVSLLPSVWLKYGDDLRALVRRHPVIFGGLAERFNYETDTPKTYRAGRYADEWGCVWTNSQEGMESIVTEHPVKTREDIIKLQIPGCRDGRLPHGFMYLRVLDLRGFEEAMIDFAEEPPELQVLLDKILAYNCIQIEAVLPGAGEMVVFGDDLGMQNGLAIGREKWLKYFYPCYKKMFGMVRQAGKLVYFHSDGCIHEIIPALIECGVSMLNPQFRANGLDNIVRACKGKVAINLDLDRQLFPFASPAELKDHVREAVEAMYMPEGGLGISIEIDQAVPLANIEALSDAAETYRLYKG
ncbi:MAG: hypothetical protein LBS62_03955 [Clostridiales bacterium]|nr:hypothetical protein [Clostridiales bacterium]